MKKAILILCGLILLITGCTKTMYVPVESVHVDTLYNTNIVRDSIYMHDSVYVENRTAGDTVYNTKYVTRWRYRNKTIHDTTYISKRDSIPVPYPVERKLTGWEQMKIDYGGKVMILVALLAIGWIARVVVRFVRKRP